MPLARLRRSLQTAASILGDHWFERRVGVEVLGRIEPGAFGAVRGGNGARGRAYHPTRARHFRALMAAVGLPGGLGFLDVGAGKGLVLLLAAERRPAFSRIVGVEYADALCAVARDNVARHGTVRPHVAPIEVVHADAATHPVPDDVHVVYLFNPFDDVVLAAVLDQLRASLARAPRPVWVLTNKADLGPAGAGWLRLARAMSYGSAEFRVYRGGAGAAGGPPAAG